MMRKYIEEKQKWRMYVTIFSVFKVWNTSLKSKTDSFKQKQKSSRQNLESFMQISTVKPMFPHKVKCLEIEIQIFVTKQIKGMIDHIILYKHYSLQLDDLFTWMNLATIRKK